MWQILNKRCNVRVNDQFEMMSCSSVLRHNKLLTNAKYYSETDEK